jgi:hypothetical protein
MSSSSCSFLADFKGLNVALHTINFPNLTPDLLVLVLPQLGTENLHTKEEETEEEEEEEEEAAAVQNFLQPNCKEKLLQVMLLLLLLLLLLLMAMHLSHAATASNDNDGDGHLSLKLKIKPSDAADDAIVLLSCATQQTTCKRETNCL